jgi:hypothetical protein
MHHIQRIKNGIVPTMGGRPTDGVRPPELDNTRKPLIDQFIGSQQLQCWFRTLPLANPTIIAGSSAWYGLGAWTYRDIGQEAAVSGFLAQLGPGYDGVHADDDAASNTAQWTKTDGAGAAIVIGIDLPNFQLGQWYSGPANIPWVEDGTSQRSGYVPAGTEQVVLHFPPALGASATPIGRGVIANQFTPLCWPLTQGRQLGVALVVRRNFINGITKSNGVAGYADIQLTVANTLTRQNFNV